MNRKDEEIYWLKESLKIDPYMRNPLINLAGSCQDDGNIEEAASYLERAITSDPDENKLLELRLNLLMSPIHSSWENMINERLQCIQNVKEIIHKYETAPLNPKVKLDSSMDRIHFYIVYHGLNDRYMQELIIKTYKLYMANFNNVFPQLIGTHSLSLLQQQLRSNSFLQSRNIPFSLKEYSNSNNLITTLTRKIRVGFFSKFFGIFEPHGLLLDGIMKYLPREYFHVIAFPVARTDGKPLEFTIQEGADEVFELSLSQEHAAEFIAKLNIDIIIFGDTMSEPMTHFMAHTKLAKIQIAFWGNPITSGSNNMDYFVSADVMEHPYRTRMPVRDDPYTEQVVLLGGQGIWYYKPTPQDEYLKKANLMGKIAPYEKMYRSEFQLKDEWFLYFCPQSVFKIHPLFDDVLLNIIKGNPEGHIVLTGGRRTSWTNVYKDRLMKKFENYTNNIHIIERVSSEKFNQLLNLSDVILHPFPFDGSKTSADGLIAGKPVLTLPTEYLRGRMGGSFLRTMNIPELMAKNQSNYINIAIKLSKDKSFYNSIKTKVINRLDLIWEDMEVPFGWGQFLSKVVGMQPHTWDQFLKQSGRNIEIENKRLAIRQSNRLEFDRVWGNEYWLLQDGVARLESHLDATMKPRIFEDWKTMNGIIMNDNNGNGDNKINANNNNNQVLSSTIKSNSEKDIIGEKLIHSINVKSNVKVSSKDSSDYKNDIVRDEFNMVHGYEGILKEIRDLASVGNCEEAYQLAITIFDIFKNDPLYLIDLGSIQFFRGENDEAYKLCNRAAELAPDSLLAHVCMGVTSTYSTNQENSINALKKAMELEFVPQKPELISTIFTVTPETIILNLLFALKQFDRWEECAEFVVDYAKLPPLPKGGALIFTFSFIKWEESREKQIYELEYDLRSKGLLQLPLNTSLHNEINRIQRDFEQVLNPCFECIMRLITIEYKQALLTTLWSVVGVSDEDIPDEEPNNLPTNPTIKSVLNDGLIKISEDKIIEKEKGFALITQYYEPVSEQIKLDMDDALILNLNNDLISDIFLFTEDILDFSNFVNKHKITQIMLGRRCTFKDVFTFANDKLLGRTVMVANSDIYFDHTLKRLVGKYNKITYFGNTVLTLLKWHKQTETELKFLLRSDSQDAWIFQPPLNSSIIDHSDFYIGAVRCDNRLAELLVIGGHHVINPAFAIHAIEIQNTPRDGKLYNVKGSAFGDVRNVLISHQSIF
jgi:predicted O-linked N-acetylglucosamine transferase (SPINDLY family)